MIIQTLGKKYVVVKCYFSNSHMAHFLCREETSGERCCVITIKDKEWIENTMGFLMKTAENLAFVDFQFCFSSEEFVHLVFSYAAGATLQEKMTREASSLEERMIIGKNLLERLMMLKMPDYFMQDCLKPESIVIQSDLDIFFQYELHNIAEYHKVQFSHVCVQLCKVFEFVFQKELKKKQIPLLKNFLTQLRKGTWADLMGIYTEYMQICEKIKKMTPEELAQPKTWAFLSWDRVWRYAGVVKKFLAVLLVLAAVFYLGHTVHRSMKKPEIKKSFDYIGTLDLNV